MTLALLDAPEPSTPQADCLLPMWLRIWGDPPPAVQRCLAAMGCGAGCATVHPSLQPEEEHLGGVVPTCTDLMATMQQQLISDAAQDRRIFRRRAAMRKAASSVPRQVSSSGSTVPSLPSLGRRPQHLEDLPSEPLRSAPVAGRAHTH